VTIERQITQFVSSRSRLPICDACVADHLALQIRQVSSAVRSIDAERLKRYKGRCSGCCTSRTVMEEAA
jgi:hypothetical protein